MSYEYEMICEREGCGHRGYGHNNETAVCMNCDCPRFVMTRFTCYECGMTLVCPGADCPREAKCPTCTEFNECPNHWVD